MSELISIWCFIIGDTQTFRVVINPAGSVDRLKQQIKTQQQPALDHLDADSLILHRVAICESLDKSKTKRIEELERLSQNLNESTALDEEDQLSETFGNNLQGKEYYVLVQLPKGEPIGSVIACR